MILLFSVHPSTVCPVHVTHKHPTLRLSSWCVSLLTCSLRVHFLIIVNDSEHEARAGGGKEIKARRVCWVIMTSITRVFSGIFPLCSFFCWDLATMLTMPDIHIHRSEDMKKQRHPHALNGSLATAWCRQLSRQTSGTAVALDAVSGPT